MKNLFLIMLILLLGISYQTYAQGNLLITPKRVVFEGNTQKAELNLMNTGTDTATYSISFRQYNMTEQGNLELIEKPDISNMFADQYLRIFPRRVTLAPQEAQVIRLQLKRSKNMAPGEYRSHIWFRDEKNNKALEKNVEPKLETNQLSVSVTAIFGITIPVIIRTGAVIVSSTLSDLKLDKQQDTISLLKLNINRTGNISIYGNLTVEYFPPQGKPYVVGSIKGVGVYTNINKRNVTIKLNKTPGLTFETGLLKVRYTSADEAKKVEVYAEEILELK